MEHFEAKGKLTDGVIEVLWNMASRIHYHEISNDTINETLISIVNILKVIDQTTSLQTLQSVSGPNSRWKSKLMRRMLHQLEKEPHNLAIMKLFELVGNLFEETIDPDSLNSLHAPNPNVIETDADDFDIPRKTIINRLEAEFDLIFSVRKQLIHYLDVTQQNQGTQDDRKMQLETRLNFIRYFLREGQTFLAYEHANLIWNGLVVNSENNFGNEIGFMWFTSLMSDEPDLQENSIYKFFIENILQYNTSNLTQTVINCFSSFFR